MYSAIFVLIMTGQSFNAISIATAEFDSMEKCERAGRAFLDQAKSFNTHQFTCQEK